MAKYVDATRSVPHTCVLRLADRRPRFQTRGRTSVSTPRRPRARHPVHNPVHAGALHHAGDRSSGSMSSLPILPSLKPSSYPSE